MKSLRSPGNCGGLARTAWPESEQYPNIFLPPLRWQCGTSGLQKTLLFPDVEWVPCSFFRSVSGIRVFQHSLFIIYLYLYKARMIWLSPDHSLFQFISTVICLTRNTTCQSPLSGLPHFYEEKPMKTKMGNLACQFPQSGEPHFYMLLSLKH